MNYLKFVTQSTIATAFLLFSSTVFASGTFSCMASTNINAENFSISWATQQSGVGNPFDGLFTIEWKGKTYLLSGNGKKIEGNDVVTIQAQVVGYWKEGSDKLLLKIADDQVLDTLVQIEVFPTKSGNETVLQGEAYLKLTKTMPPRKVGVRCY